RDRGVDEINLPDRAALATQIERLCLRAGADAVVDLVLVGRSTLVDDAQAYEQQIGPLHAQTDGAEAPLLAPHRSGVVVSAEARLLAAELLPARDGRRTGRGPWRRSRRRTGRP